MKSGKRLDRKGQVAIEYLTTYGWVLLVVVIGVGAISYFGMLSPSNYLPDRCWFGAQLVCEDYRLSGGSSSSVDMKLRNSFTKPIKITDIKRVDISPPGGMSGGSSCPTGGETVDIAVSAIGEISCDFTGQESEFAPGEKHSIPILITFERNDTSSPPSHNLTGEIFVTAN